MFGNTNKCVLAIDVTSRGFGFTIFEGPHVLVDWGVKQLQPYDEERCVRHLENLIQRYQPELLVLENWRQKTRKRSARVLTLLERIVLLARAAEIPIRLVGWRRVMLAFATNGFINKYGIARAVGRLLPELADRVPPFRKAWMSEDYRMAMFDAAALGLTYYSSLKAFRNLIRSHDEEIDPGLSD